MKNFNKLSAASLALAVIAAVAALAGCGSRAVATVEEPSTHTASDNAAKPTPKTSKTAEAPEIKTEEKATDAETQKPAANAATGKTSAPARTATTAAAAAAPAQAQTEAPAGQQEQTSTQQQETAAPVQTETKQETSQNQTPSTPSTTKPETPAQDTSKEEDKKNDTKNDTKDDKADDTQPGGTETPAETPDKPDAGDTNGGETPDKPDTGDSGNTEMPDTPDTPDPGDHKDTDDKGEQPSEKPDEKPDDKPTYTYTVTVVEPTCTERGYTLHTCNEDPAQSFKDHFVEAKGHSWEEGVVTVEPTVDQEGVRTFTCADCGETRTETIDKLERTYTDEVVAPTCTTAGYTKHTCDQTGETEYIDPTEALGHAYENGVCTRCGEADPDYQKPAEKPDSGNTGDGGDAETPDKPDTGDSGNTETPDTPDTGDSGNTETPDQPEQKYTYIEWIQKEATCEEEGLIYYECREDASKSYYQSIPKAKNHQWENKYGYSVCATCGVWRDFNAARFNKDIYEQTNAYREENGVAPLKYYSEWQAAADKRAAEVVEKYKASIAAGMSPSAAIGNNMHWRPNGEIADTVMADCGFPSYMVTENYGCVLVGYNMTRMMNGWKNSAGHNTNLLYPGYNGIIVGTASYDGWTFGLQLFLRVPDDYQSPEDTADTQSVEEQEEALAEVLLSDDQTSEQAAAETAAPEMESADLEETDENAEAEVLPDTEDEVEADLSETPDSDELPEQEAPLPDENADEIPAEAPEEAEVPQLDEDTLYTTDDFAPGGQENPDTVEVDAEEFTPADSDEAAEASAEAELSVETADGAAAETA